MQPPEKSPVIASTHTSGNGSGVDIANEPPARDAAGIVRELEDHSHVPTQSAPGTGRTLAIFILVLAIVLCGAFWYSHHRNSNAADDLARSANESADTAAPVDVVRVSYSSPSSALELPGEASAWYASTIYARVSGYIDTWYKDIGDKVAKGDVLATMETPELDDQLKAAEARVAADKSLVAVAQSNQEFAKIQQQRWATAQPGVVAKMETDEKNAQYVSAGARLKAAKSQVDLDQSEVNRLRDLTNFKNVIAPYEGVITARHIDKGDLVTAGSTSNTTSLYDIVQSNKIRVFVDAPQVASTLIHVGMAATATGREFSGQTFTGTVARTSESIDPAAKTLKVEVDIPNPHLALKPGMYLEVTFQTNTLRPPVEVPAAALNFRTGGPQVAVVDGKGIVHFREVTISRDMGNVVELGSGVAAGDMVALNISNQIADGDKVQANVQTDSLHNPMASEAHMAMAQPAH